MPDTPKVWNGSILLYACAADGQHIDRPPWWLWQQKWVRLLCVHSWVIYIQHLAANACLCPTVQIVRPWFHINEHNQSTCIQSYSLYTVQHWEWWKVCLRLHTEIWWLWNVSACIELSTHSVLFIKQFLNQYSVMTQWATSCQISWWNIVLC